ncbi:TPA: 50S ribosomal protein L33 [Candidatus Dependentiae bacterium]|nr:50S ribosomal protein L33 [Candidatus Dependentiae bacterium]
MAKDRVVSHLACEKCRSRNYTQVVTRKRKVGDLKLNKHCSSCREHTAHKETK